MSQYIAYLTAGYPNAEETVNMLLAMQTGGADVLELCVEGEGLAVAGLEEDE